MAMALAACGALAAIFVGALYVPPLVLRLRPKSQLEHLLQRFASALIVSIVAPLFCLLLLPPKEASSASRILRIFGFRSDHLLQATFFPLTLTALLYLGPLFVLAMDAVEEEAEATEHSSWVASLISLTGNPVAWRNYVVAPICEEVVFRACMVPLLVCAGYSPYAAVFICPLFFSIAHGHRFWELVHYEKYSRRKASVIVGIQLAYTVIFGWYAAFLFVRTGHLLAAIVPHIFCNIMGLPNVLRAAHSRVLALVYLTGLLCFVGLLSPLSNPALYDNEDAACHLKAR